MNVVVVDASAGVKWFRAEQGHDVMDDLLERHVQGEVQIHVPPIFVHEFVHVACRELGPIRAQALVTRLAGWGIAVHPLSGRLIAEALAVVEERGAAFYDAQATALARMLGTPLYSADVRAHGKESGAVIVG